MNEKLEKGKLIEAHKIYSSEAMQLWNKLKKKYDFDEQTALTIVGDFWYEPDYAEEFMEEWMEGSDEIGNDIEKQFNVLVEHEEELITIRNENFVYDGDIVIREEYRYKK